MLMKILTGGFFAGYRTYIMGGLLILQALAGWAVGDATSAHLVEQLPEIIGGLGLMSLRAAK